VSTEICIFLADKPLS